MPETIYGQGVSRGAVKPDLTVNDPNDPRYVEGRTHWIVPNPKNIEWDGNTDGLESVTIGSYSPYYKVTDNYFTVDELSQCKFMATDGTNTQDLTSSVSILDVPNGGYATVGYYDTPYIVTIYDEEKFNALLEGNYEPGTYLLLSNGGWFNAIFPDTVFPLEDKFLSAAVRQPDWSKNDESATGHVKNRTHYVSDEPIHEVIEFDYTVDGYDVTTADKFQLNALYYYVKVSDSILKKEDFLGLTMVGDTGDGEQTETITEEEYAANVNEFNGCTRWSILLLSLSSTEFTVGDNTYTAPSTGLYLLDFYKTMHAWGDESVTKFTAKFTFANKHIPLDRRFIPDSIARVEDIPEIPVAEAVADAVGDTPTATEFNALLAALRSAGIIKSE